MDIENIIAFLNEKGKPEYANEVARIAGIEPKELTVSDELNPDEIYDKNYQKFKEGERDPKFMQILTDEALEEYEAYGTFSGDIKSVLAEAISTDNVSNHSKTVLQDLYEYLEDVNFHQHLIAIEYRTGIDYS